MKDFTNLSVTVDCSLKKPTCTKDTKKCSELKQVVASMFPKLPENTGDLYLCKSHYDLVCMCLLKPLLISQLGMLSPLLIKSNNVAILRVNKVKVTCICLCGITGQLLFLFLLPFICFGRDFLLFFFVATIQEITEVSCGCNHQIL